MLRLALLACSLMIASCGDEQSSDPRPAPCSDQWVQLVEQNLPTGDGQGHGPDPGSSEWRSVVEFKLGIRGDPDIPALDSNDWCTYIDQLMQNKSEAQ